MIKTYNHKQYGSVTLRLAEERPVKGWWVADLPEKFIYPLDTLEKIALITDNVGICHAIASANRCAFGVYTSPSTVRLATIQSLTFTCERTAAEEIERVRPRYGGYIHL